MSLIDHLWAYVTHGEWQMASGALTGFLGLHELLGRCLGKALAWLAWACRVNHVRPRVLESVMTVLACALGSVLRQLPHPAN